MTLRCNCSIDAGKLPPFTQPHFNLSAHYEPARYLFLLGYPFSGTSALHFLLATSISVATLGDPGLLGPSKEGWHVSHVKGGHDSAGQRWNASAPIPWQTLFDVYHSAWNLSRPILLENSPPEIIHAPDLNATFSPGGKVRFLLLVRSACSKGDISQPELARQLATIRSIIDAFKEDVYVLRYEDLCLRWEETLLQITAWEPRLGDMDISRVPGGASHRQLHAHAQVSILKYCKAARSAWQWRVMEAPGLPRSCANSQLTQNVSDSCKMATYFGYEQIDACARTRL